MARARRRSPSQPKLLRPRGGTLVLLCALVLSACGDSAGPVGPLAPATMSATAQAFVALMNDHRSSVGCLPLRWDEPAAAVAHRHSADMVARGFFGHVNPDGLTLADRLRLGGVRYRAAGENIAAGQRTPEEVFGAWLRSRTHRELIESCGFTHQGLGREGNHWTLVLLTPPEGS